MKAFNNLALCAVVGMALITPVHAQIGMEVQPVVIKLQEVPNMTVQQSVTLTNLSDGDQRISVEPGSLYNHQGIRASSTTESIPSLEEWISIEEELYLRSGETLEIPFTVEIPENVSPGAYGSLIEFATSSTTGSNLGVKAVFQLPVFLNVEGETNHSMDFIDVFLDGSSSYEQGTLKTIVVLKNSGSVYETPKGDFRLRNEKGHYLDLQEVVGDLKDRVFLPNMQRGVPVELAVVAPGKYTMEGQLQLGDGSDLDFEATVEYKPEIALSEVIYATTENSIIATVENTGNVKLSPSTYVEMRNSLGVKIYDAEQSMNPLIPGEKERLTFEDLPPCGEVDRCVVTVETVDQDLSAINKTIIIGNYFLLLLSIVGGAILLFLVFGLLHAWKEHHSHNKPHEKHTKKTV